MFDHDALTESYAPYAETAQTSYGEEMGYSPEQIEMIEAEEAEGYLYPSEVDELELQYETMDSLPPEEAMAYENDAVSTEESVAENSEETSLDDAENFDQEVINGDDSSDDSDDSDD